MGSSWLPPPWPPPPPTLGRWGGVGPHLGRPLTPYIKRATPMRREHTRKGRAHELSPPPPSPPAPLSSSPCAGTQLGALTEEEEGSQAARRRAAGSPSPAHLLPQLHWIGEEEEVVFHRTCAKPSRYCTCGTRFRAVFVNIKFVVELRDHRDLEVAS